MHRIDIVKYVLQAQGYVGDIDAEAKRLNDILTEEFKKRTHKLRCLRYSRKAAQEREKAKKGEREALSALSLAKKRYGSE